MIPIFLSMAPRKLSNISSLVVFTLQSHVLHSATEGRIAKSAILSKLES